jgi:hypothetical protein
LAGSGRRQATAPRLTLPAGYGFHDSFFTQDVRLSRTFPLRSERVHLALLGEVFNLFNVANLAGYGGSIANSAQFGQPAEARTIVRPFRVHPELLL